MKILILMPLDEKQVYNSAAIRRELPENLQDQCFAMPMFMEYLIQTKTSKNWAYAFFDSIISGKNLYKAAAEKKEDFIVIGNLPQDFKFDAVFNVQSLDHDEEYKDLFADKMREICQEDDQLMALANLHKGSESTFTMHNAKAIADFIAAYVQTDPHLDEIKERYKDKINFKDVK